MNVRAREVVSLLVGLGAVAAILGLAWVFNYLNANSEAVQTVINLDIDLGTLIGGVLIGSAAVYAASTFGKGRGGPDSNGSDGAGPDGLPGGDPSEEAFRNLAAGDSGPHEQLVLIYRKLARIEKRLAAR